MLLRLLLVPLSALVAFVIYTTVWPLDPALDRTDAFERRIYISANFPFVSTYLLYSPEDQSKGQTYPLIVALHGGYKRSLGARVASTKSFQTRFPAFILMPMAPGTALWAGHRWRERLPTESDAIGDVVVLVNKLVDQHPIDRSRIYVTGSSNGAAGTFAALDLFPDVFAAGAAVNGYWPEDRAKRLRSAKLLIFHGTEDPLFDDAQRLQAAIRRQGGRSVFREMPSVGHDSGPAYSSADLWEWLMRQRRQPS